MSTALPTTSSSLWLGDDHSPSPETADLPAAVDVLIVGAGITGVVHALELAEAGVRVGIVDHRPTAALGATGHSSAKVSVLQGTAAADIASISGTEVARRHVLANQYGLDWIARRIAEHEIECSWERRAAVTYTAAAGHVPRIEREAELIASVRSDVVVETPALPFTTAAAVRVEGQGQLDPAALVRGLVRVAREAGATFHFGVRVHGLDGDDVVTDTGRIRARHVVSATGLPFADRTLLFARAEPQSSYVLAVETELDPPEDMYLSTDEPKRSLRTAVAPDGSRLLLVGGEGHKTGQGGDTLDRYRALRTFAAEHFGVRSVRHRFMTEDFTTPDHRPYAGPGWPADERLLVSTGYNKWGFTNAVACAAVNVAHITGADAPVWADDFSPRRLPLRSVPSLLKANADVGLHLAGGWISTLAPAGPPRPGRGRVVGSGLDRVAVSSDETGAPCSVSGVCPHLGAILAWNPAEQTWDCPLHGSRFRRTGELLHGPAVDDLSETRGEARRS